MGSTLPCSWVIDANLVGNHFHQNFITHNFSFEKKTKSRQQYLRSGCPSITAYPVGRAPAPSRLRAQGVFKEHLLQDVKIYWLSTGLLWKHQLGHRSDEGTSVPTIHSRPGADSCEDSGLWPGSKPSQPRPPHCMSQWWTAAHLKHSNKPIFFKKGKKNNNMAFNKIN